MQALVYHGPGHKAWEEVPEPEITDDGDVIVRVDATTICGTDLHILAGDVPEVLPGRIVGHEAVGTVVEAGDGVHTLAPGDSITFHLNFHHLEPNVTLEGMTSLFLGLFLCKFWIFVI